MRLVIHKLPRTAGGERSGLSAQRLQQGGRVVAAEVHDTVDEQGRCTLHLTGGHSALDIPSNTTQDLGAGPVSVESGDIELELPRVVLQIVVLEGGLMTVEQIVHFPEPVLVAAASAAAAAAKAWGWISVSGKWRKAKRISPFGLCSTRSISRNACRE